MSFTIYTAGDATFLSEVFNSVAMVSGSGAIGSVAAVGALVTVLLLGFRAILEGGQAIRFEELLLGFVVYMVAFYPTTTVLVEDGYTGHVHPVDNVPLGPAVAGWAASSVGYKLTSIFETGYRFSAHGSNDSLHRFAEPLELLMRLRSSATNPLVMSAWNGQLGPYADMRRSWENYYKHCTLIKVDLGLTTIDKIIHGDFLEATKFDSEIYGTQLFLDRQGGTEHTCADAHILLREATALATVPGSQSDQLMHAFLTKGLEEGGWGVGMSATDKMEAQASPLLGYAVDIQKYMQATVLDPVFNDAVEGRYQDMQDVAAAIAFRQSLAQRNTQWSQESTAFMTVIRPAMTFFEGFVYAITPMMAMLLVMGRFGMNLAGKYLQTVFWVQLWLPILSICNLYIRNAADKQIQATYSQAASFGNLNYESFYMVNNIPEVVESWLAVGSMLAAATPMLSFFLISGSAYAFTNIAGRLSGQDHFDEKQVSPNAVNMGAVNDVAPMMSHTIGGGGVLSGTAGYTQEVSISEGYANELSSARSNELAAQKGFSNTFSSAMKESVSQGKGFQTLNSLSKSGIFSESKTAGLDQSEIEKVAKQHGVSSSTVAQHVMSVGAAATAGFKIGGFGASVSAETKQNWSEEQQKKYDETIASLAQQSLSKGMGTSLMDQLSEGFSRQGSESFMSGAESSTTRQLTESAQKHQATREQYAQLSSKKDGYTNTQKYKYNEVGANLHTAGLGSKMAALAGSSKELNDAAIGYENMFRQRFGWSPEVARNAGMFNAVMQHGTSDQRLAALGLLSEATGGYNASGPLVDNSHLTGVDPSSIQRQGVGAVEDLSGIQVGSANMDQLFKDGGAKVVREHNASLDRKVGLDALERQAGSAVPMSAKLNAQTLANTHTEALVGAIKAGNVDGPVSSAVLRAATLQGNTQVGRTQEFANDLAPLLSKGAADYMAEVRLGGGFAEYTEPAYQAWRDEFAERDAHGNIMRDESGSAILSASNERVLALNKAIIDRNANTNSAYAEREIGQMSMSNQRLGFMPQGR